MPKGRMKQCLWNLNYSLLNIFHIRGPTIKFPSRLFDFQLCRARLL